MDAGFGSFAIFCSVIRFSMRFKAREEAVWGRGGRLNRRRLVGARNVAVFKAMLTEVILPVWRLN